MNNRIISVVATAILVTLTSGCCNMSTLWFGRGARCGLCNKLSCLTQPTFGNVMQAPCGCQPFSAAPPVAPAAPAPPSVWQAPRCLTPNRQAPTCQTPACQSAPGGCGCNSYAEAPGQQSCGSCYSSGYADCGCGETGQDYGSYHSDPYLQGGGNEWSSSDYGVPQPGEVINGETVVGPGYGGQVIPGQSYPGSGSVSPDNFQQRSGGYPQGNYQSNKFDTDGKRILWEEPLPSGSEAN